MSDLHLARRRMPINTFGRLIDFSEVDIGQRFLTVNRKRLMMCVKIGLCGYGGHMVNAVVLRDHAGEPALDLGGMTVIEDCEQVEILL